MAAVDELLHEDGVGIVAEKPQAQANISSKSAKTQMLEELRQVLKPPPVDGRASSSQGRRRPGARLLTVARKDVLFLDDLTERGGSSASTATSHQTSTLSSGASRMSSYSRAGSTYGDHGYASPMSFALPPRTPRLTPLPGAWSPPPAWSMRYCQYMGASKAGLQKLGQENTDKFAVVDRRQQLGLKPMEKKTAVEDSSSLFTLKKIPDKRVQRIAEMEHNLRDCRLTGRRGALKGTLQPERQVQLAIKMMTGRHPGHMRKLLKLFKTAASTGFAVDMDKKTLSSKQLELFTGKLGMGDEEIQTLWEAFNRDDVDDDGYLTRQELKQGLADLGLQPTNREEKLEVQEVLCDHDLEGLGFCNFDEYLQLVVTIRVRLRHIRQAKFVQAFTEMDTDGSGTMDEDEAMELLSKKMGIAPRNEDEGIEISTILSNVDADNDGQVDIHQCQEFAQRVRAKISIMRREEEMTIARAFHLEQHMLAEFRTDLPVLWEIFTRYDLHGKHCVLDVDLMALLMDTGVTPTNPDSTRMAAAHITIECYSRPENDFLQVLNIIHHARQRCIEFMSDELSARFNAYDRHHVGELGRTDIFQILEDFKMLPRSREEQEEVVQVIDRLDEDGSGTFNLKEFIEFFQRLTEQVEQGTRKREKQACKALGFNEDQITILRRVFLQLGPDGKSKVATLDLAHALPELCAVGNLGEPKLDRIKDLTKQAQAAPDHRLDFAGFVQVVWQVQLEVQLEEPEAAFMGQNEQQLAYRSAVAAESASPRTKVNADRNAAGPGGATEDGQGGDDPTPAVSRSGRTHKPPAVTRRKSGGTKLFA